MSRSLGPRAARCLLALWLAAAAPIVAPRHHPARRHLHTAPLVVLPAPRPKPAPVPLPPARPVPPRPTDIGASTGLHLPRFAALKTDDVNMRSGPGERYPVLWVYRRRGLPVQITREFDVWRLVTDMDGVRGWVHQATLTGRRGFVITGTTDRTLRAEPDAAADAVAILRPGVVGRLRRCDPGSDWCEIEAGGYRGWLLREAFWGAAPGEAVQP